MKKAIGLMLLFVAANSYAQLYVSSGSYVYNKGTLVFVNQDIHLQNNGAFYLRNEGQLVQGAATTNSANKGEGVVSVFQEGTSDNYDYNYWCSPIGIPSITLGNDSFGIALLSQPATVTASTPATILAMNSYDGMANPLSIAPYWIYKFLSSTNYSQWFQVGANSTILPGEGFTMKGTSGTDTTDIESNGVQNNAGGVGAQRYDFRGKPNDGDITVNVNANTFTLTGNPYPSALHVNAFLLDGTNTACTGSAYYWEQNKATNSHYLAQYQGGYGAYSPVSLGSNGIYVPATFNTYNGDGSLNANGVSSGLSIERKYAPIGQGFMIKGSAPSAVTLRNSHREFYKENGALSQFERSSQPGAASLLNVNEGQPVSLFRMNTTFNEQFTKQIALAFIPEATDGVDRGIDALGASPLTLPNDVYFFLDNNRYVIEGINFDLAKRIPLGVRATDNAAFKFHILAIENFDENQNIYLYDGLDGTYHDIKNDTYTVTLPTGTYNNRFEITFLNPTLHVDNTIQNNFVILQNNANQMVTVFNPNLLEVKSVSLYDLTGKRIFSKGKLGVQERYQFATHGLADSVYLVELLTNDNRKEVQKIVILNTAN